MEKTSALAALAQENRLDVFFLLVEAGPDRRSAGGVAEALGVGPNRLTFQCGAFAAGLKLSLLNARCSRSRPARFETINALRGILYGAANDSSP
jgi:hypothetical protein